MKTTMFCVLAAAVLTRPCDIPVSECSHFCGPRPIKSLTRNENNTVTCECEDYAPCILVPKEVER